MSTAPAPLADAVRDRLLAAHSDAAAFFRQRLAGAAGAGPRAYLTRRGFGDALGSQVWEVGYAPVGWTALTDHLRRLGYSDAELLASGLGLSTRRRTVVDRFRDRITFGIRDESGDVVGFVARAAPGDVDVPKYLNSPRTLLYDKSAVLFGLTDQRDLLAAGGVPVLVEGPLDALAVRLANRHNDSALVGLAPCGTALTAAHMATIVRSTHSAPLVVFDADVAGVRAAAHAHSLMATGFPGARSVRLPRGTDPADVLARLGRGGLARALTATTPLADCVVDSTLHFYEGRLENAEARVSALREVAPNVATLPRDQVARQVERLATLLGFDLRTVTRELSEAATAAGFHPQPRNRRSRPQPSGPVGPAAPSGGSLGKTRSLGGC